jgi:hypothetical protein
MFKGGVDIFVLIAHFLNDNRTLSCNFGFFQIENKSRNAMTLQLNDLLAKYGLNAHIVA